MSEQRTRKQNQEHKKQTCNRKLRYSTHKDAHTTRKTLIKKRGDAARKLQVYLCDVCLCYHLGTPTKAQKIAQKQLKREREEYELMLLNQQLQKELP